ncbi:MULTISPECIES: ABC transporter ATP-binding protein [unclassified Paenibacillus]|uniref:ABC transporter ATP-binding protein n=1 Tax=unclassified Paenibacillus TaxID=185978 RepID=UPI001AE70018|nr:MULTISPECIES: ABC transporter ATP-binding protein [unclassified Paenibacillus]MBP1157407.1 ATP-binding cassette subfamily B protein [Paenibacillus sp. PvP091]MBP1171855.1 ATP-binding cassette subfamily B protein [Paenibacillus sp. PvR098]MBP2438236.1 ATP-binding cassette subfamily B protein [Paenibacillus sp. PvP052]
MFNPPTPFQPAGGRGPSAARIGAPVPKGKPFAKHGLRTLRNIWTYLSVHRRFLVLIFMMVIISSLLGLLGPYLLGVTIDTYMGTEQNQGLFTLMMILGGVYLLHSISTWLQNYWMIGVAQQTVYAMRSDLFRHLHKLPVSFFAKRQHGEVMSRLTNDIDNVSQTLNSSFIQLVSSVLTFIGMIGLMIWLSMPLTLITLSMIPIMVLGMKWITARTGKYFKEQQRNMGELNGFVEEALSGQSVVKAFSREENMISEFNAKAEKLKAAGYWAQTYSGFITKLMNVLNNLSFAVIAGAGGVLALHDMVSIGVIVTFAEYSRQFTRPLNDLANQWNTFLSAVAGAERVFEVLEEDEEEKDEKKAISLSGLRGDIEFADVSFSYNQETQTLKGMDFHISSGETVALVGPTGAGKSTVVQLLTRFYDADHGQIFIDGYDIRNIKRASLRGHMGFVLQDAFLFQGTIRDNIRYGRLEATDQEVEQAAKLANAHSFIMKLPERYDTAVHHDGSGISQGQKQLLSIARAVLADPSILILDEATSSIDTITEIKIQEALSRLMKGRTNVVIAHRLNTIQKADQILVIDEGRLIERGTHGSLLKEKGYYYGLFHSQSQNEPVS